MRLESLYQNFSTSSPEAQARHNIAYRAQRAEDMLKIPTWPKPKKVSAKAIKTIPLTEEEQVLMSLMGLKKKDIVALRTLKES